MSGRGAERDDDAGDRNLKNRLADCCDEVSHALLLPLLDVRAHG
jgi:retron-type reverse transcriptase